ncbi:MAG: beta-glucuronidase [Clostridium sp.]|nr:beta-glucuronidase [Clostridium sp.]
MLYPKMTESRMVFDLNGVWDFCLMDGEAKGEIVPMPVPSSYNDIYTGRDFADHVGNLYYRRTFTVSSRMLEKRLFLRFGSVTHKAEVWLNGTCLGKHSGGFLPFSFEITETAIAGENELEVIVNNIVDETTLPAGRMVHQKFPGLPEEIHNLPNFDFYNYSGIMRPVCLYTAPESYIEDISIYGKMDGSFYWDVKANGEGTVSVRLLDAAGNEVAAGEGFKGTGQIDQVQLWEPGHPVLYSLEVTLTGSDGEKDTYTEVFGFREVSIRDCRIHLNGKPVYLKGFGKHEDSPVHGRGFDMAYNVKDIGLLKWIGANSFRTSHYPYCEEMLQLCDREGILVIDEAPAVGLNAGFTATGLLGGNPNRTWKLFKTAEHHRQVLRDMVQRDKNHPCVIIWSVANEPASQEDGAKEYFEPLLNLVRELDEQKRPATLVTYEGSNPVSCKVAEICDLLIINRYRGWYDTEGNLRGAAALLKDELEGFHKRCPDKPIMLGEYGADTIAGFHDINARIFSEEYQVDFLRAYGEVFDSLPYITGEHVWNFADFATAENIKRVGGNKKGVFTRDRSPKMAAHFLKERWEGIS